MRPPSARRPGPAAALAGGRPVRGGSSRDARRAALRRAGSRRGRSRAAARTARPSGSGRGAGAASGAPARRRRLDAQRIEATSPASSRSTSSAACLVQRLVAVAALAATGCSRDTRRRTGSRATSSSVRATSRSRSAKPCSARPAPPGTRVVDEDRRPAGLRVAGVGDAADVVAVRDGQQREQPDHRVLDRVDPAHEVQPARGEARRAAPAAARSRTRPSRRSAAARRAGGCEIGSPSNSRFFWYSRMRTVTLSRPSPARNGPTVPRRRAARGSRSPCRPGRRCSSRRAPARRATVRRSASSSRDEEGLPAVKVDRARDGTRGRRACRRCVPSVAPVPRVDDRERLARRARVDVAVRPAPERDRSARRRASWTSRPSRDQRARRRSAPRRAPALELRRGQRLLGRGADQVLAGDERVPRVEHRLLELAAEEQVRVLDDVLVQRVGHRDQHDQAPSRSCRPTRPMRCHEEISEPGIADEDADVQPADVDAQLERAGGEHRGQLAAEQPRLERGAAPRAGSPRGTARRGRAAPAPAAPARCGAAR